MVRHVTIEWPNSNGAIATTNGIIKHSVVVILVLLAGAGISLIESYESQLNATSATPAGLQNGTGPGLPATTTTITTTSPTPTSTSTSMKPILNDSIVSETKKIIQEHLKSSVDNRFTMNRPTLAPQTSDFAPDSSEAKVADATTRFGLNFIKNLDPNPKDNVVISPLSMQNLLGMILLGADRNTSTQAELFEVLGYEATNMIGDSTEASADLRPHEAMQSVMDSITKAIHLSISANQAPSPDLLNTNPMALNTNTSEPQAQSKGSLTAHLQTTARDNELPLSGQVNFTLANLMLTDESVMLNENYEKELKSFYNVNIEHFSKKNKPNSSVASKSSAKELPLHERVNNWVKNMTHNQIDKLANESDLDGDDLLMILLNAAHFKARWLYTFNPKATVERSFYNLGQDKLASEVKFMRQKGTFGYADFGQSASQAEALANRDSMGGKTSSLEEAETLLTEDIGAAKQDQAAPPANASSNSQPEDQQLPTIELSKEESRRIELTSKLNCSALMLPFSLNDGQELSLVILLPTSRDGLSELINTLTYQGLDEIYKSLSEQQVQVEIPKFGFESSHDAKEVLKRLGLSRIFNEAHLDSMFKPSTSKDSRKVAKVIHKAKIAVDESGAEAAAASMATVVLRNFIRPPTPIFVADHPFLFIIRHNRSNMPLFMGHVSNFQ